MHGKHVSHQGPKLVVVTRLHFNVALLLTTKHTHTHTRWVTAFRAIGGSAVTNGWTDRQTDRQTVIGKQSRHLFSIFVVLWEKLDCWKTTNSISVDARACTPAAKQHVSMETQS